MAVQAFMAEGWEDYAVLDAGDGMKLERWGAWRLARPDPQALWPPARPAKEWKGWHAWYHRSSEGGGSWEKRAELPESWTLGWRGLRFKVKPTDFKHTGLFPEQAANWAWLMERAQAAPRPLKVLNLFAYTGAASVALVKAGAEVTHVDASRGMLAWARENAQLNGLGESKLRTLVDDCQKFVDREGRRGAAYQGLILDPPSYGRGKSGETWKLEKHLWKLLQSCERLLAQGPAFVVLNTYTTGLSPLVLENLLRSMLAGRRGSLRAGELALPIQGGGLLPCGATARWHAEP